MYTNNIKTMCHVVVEDFYHKDFEMATGMFHCRLRGVVSICSDYL